MIRSYETTTVRLFDEDMTQIWSGPLADLIADNEMDADEAAGLANDLEAEDGHAILGGGAAPLFYVTLAE